MPYFGNTSTPYAGDVKGPVQEVIDRTGWASSNDIRFGIFVQALKATQFAALEHATGTEAKLDITYTVAGLPPRHYPRGVLMGVNRGVVA